MDEVYPRQAAIDTVTELIHKADGDTQVALMWLAAAFDQHLRECPHVEPPAPRFIHGIYAPLSHDEQAMLDAEPRS